MKKTEIRHGAIVAALAGILVLSGCSSDSDDAGASAGLGAVTISHQPISESKIKSQVSAAKRALPEGIDSLQVEFEDAGGQVVYGPVEVLAAPEVTLLDVPLSAASMTVDYLRNGGYALFTDEVPVAWRAAVGAASPEPEAALPSTTKWTAGMDEKGVASLTVSVEGKAAQDFLIKGVGYSPAPIGFSNKNGPGFGDVFWDTPGDFLDFEKVWRRDIEQIRGHGFNAVRTYSLIAHFINDDGTIPDQATMNTPGSLRVREHKKFLDEAWNNGVNPIYVLVGIPMPEEVFQKQYFDNPANASKITYWDDNFTATVEQMKNHPAVLGFTLFNEIGGGAEVYVENAGYAEHFWRQVEKYADRAKRAAPGKLIGWAYFDNPDFAARTVAYRSAHAKSVDFYGVNAFQTQDINEALRHWTKEQQQAAARPVLLTEFGMPTTVRIGGDQIIRELDRVHSTEDSIRLTAERISQVMPGAFKHPVMSGMFYFEWSDEWWKQAGGSDVEQEGGPGADQFPQKAWDEEGFGLNSIALNGRQANQVYTDNQWGIGGNVQVDKLTPKSALLDAVTAVYRNAEQIRRQALGLP